MIVIAIIGVIAAIAIPNYRKMSCRAQQSEGKTVGNALMRAAETHREEILLPTTPAIVVDVACNGTVTPAPNVVGFHVKGKQRYAYRLQKLGAPTVYTVTATACNGLVVGDVWIGNGANTATSGLRNTANACQ